MQLDTPRSEFKHGEVDAGPPDSITKTTLKLRLKPGPVLASLTLELILNSACKRNARHKVGMRSQARNTNSNAATNLKSAEDAAWG